LFTPQRANVTETSGVISASDVALDHAHASPLRNLRRRAERNAASKTGEPRCLTAPSRTASKNKPQASARSDREVLMTRSPARRISGSSDAAADNASITTTAAP